MFVFTDKELGLDWEFKWSYRYGMLKEPDHWVTSVYVKWTDRESGRCGVIGHAYYDWNGIDKDEARLSVLFKALERVAEQECAGIDTKVLFTRVLKDYSRKHRVPKQNTKLGEYQRRILDYL